MDEEKGSPPAASRDRIFDAAMRLFASSGYGAVSMRDIAAEVGMKAASIYNHFPSKEGLLDEALRRFRLLCYEWAGKDPSAERPAVPATVSTRDFLRDALLVHLGLLRDPRLVPLFRVVTRGQYHHSGIRDFLLHEYLRIPEAYWTGVFGSLMEAGRIRRGDPALFAKEFRSFGVARFYERSLLPDGSPVDMEEEVRLAGDHVAFFLAAVGLDGDPPE